MLSTFRVSDFDRFFDSVFASPRPLFSARQSPAFTPSLDVHEDESAFTFLLDVPGMKAEDLEVSLDQGVLTLKGKRDLEAGEAASLYRGRSYGSFTRSFTLPESADSEQLSASLADGVLSVRIGKQAKAAPRLIEIQVPQAAQLSAGEVSRTEEV